MDARALQYSHWDDFRRMIEADTKEFRCVCDHSKVLKREYVALRRRRYEEQETHVASSDLTAITALEPRTGTAANSGVRAVGERERSGAR